MSSSEQPSFISPDETITESQSFFFERESLLDEPIDPKEQLEHLSYSLPTLIISVILALIISALSWYLYSIQQDTMYLVQGNYTQTIFTTKKAIPLLTNFIANKILPMDNSQKIIQTNGQLSTFEPLVRIFKVRFILLSLKILQRDSQRRKTAPTAHPISPQEYFDHRSRKDLISRKMIFCLLAMKKIPRSAMNISGGQLDTGGQWGSCLVSSTRPYQ